MRLRERLITAFAAGDPAELEAVVAESPRCLRHLLGMTYDANPTLRASAARAIAVAARHHPAKVKEQVARIVWSMDAGSNTNATGAPEVLLAVAEEAPELLMPVVADLARLAREPRLKSGIAKLLKLLSKSRPGEIGRRISLDLNEKMETGVFDA